MSLMEADVVCLSEFFVKKSMSSSVFFSTCKDIGRSTSLSSTPLLATDFARSASEYHENEVNRSTSSPLPSLSVTETTIKSDMQGYEWYHLPLLFQAVELFFREGLQSWRKLPSTL
ncbi:hypothetical protein GQ457_01G037210 [Hibiscus cannabinus]